MLLANLALGVVANYRPGWRVHLSRRRYARGRRSRSGRHVHVWVPAAIVPMAMHVVPKRQLEQAAEQARPWLPTLRALTKELEKYPDAEFVDVATASENQHVRIRHPQRKVND